MLNFCFFTFVIYALMGICGLLFPRSKGGIRKAK